MVNYFILLMYGCQMDLSATKFSYVSVSSLNVAILMLIRDHYFYAA